MGSQFHNVFLYHTCFVKTSQTSDAPPLPLLLSYMSPPDMLICSASLLRGGGVQNFSALPSEGSPEAIRNYLISFCAWQL